MSFILSEQRDFGNWPDCWRKYEAYLKNNESTFPKAAFKLATSDWWYYSSTPKAPHDSHLISATYTERQIGFRPGKAPRQMLQRYFKDHVKGEALQKLIQETLTLNPRTVCSLEVVLKSYFKGKITLTYSGVQRYQLSMDKDAWPGHGDWRFDEFSLV